MKKTINDLIALVALATISTAHGALVLEYNASDLALTNDATGVAWVPSTYTTLMDTTLQAGSSVITPTSAYFSRAIQNANTDAITSFNSGSFAPSTSADFSFEVWVKLSNLTGDHVLFETGGGTTGAGLTIADDTLAFTVNNAGQIGSLTNTLSALPGDFVQVLGVIDFDAGGDSLSLYVNGALVDTASGLTVGGWAGANAGQLGGTAGNIAAPVGFPSNSPDSFDGEMALARFYDSALLASEVNTLYTNITAGIPPSSPLPSPYQHLDATVPGSVTVNGSDEVSQWTDQSGNGNNAVDSNGSPVPVSYTHLTLPTIQL